MAELQPNDKATLERIRGRVDDPWAPPAGGFARHYRDDVRFLIDRIDELTAGVVAAPVEDAKRLGLCGGCGLPEPWLDHTGWLAWTGAPCDGSCGVRDRTHTHHEFIPRVFVAPEVGESRECLLCSRTKPWGTFDTRSGATVCKDCTSHAERGRFGVVAEPTEEAEA